LFAVRRADIELFARELEIFGPGLRTVTRRLSTIAGFYKYAVEEDLLELLGRCSAGVAEEDRWLGLSPDQPRE
jgi:hypothetical protein